MKENLTKDELVEQFNECLSKIKLLCEIYDDGELSIAKEIAVKLRVLFHNTERCKSLIKLLQLERNTFLSTALDFDPKTVFGSHSGLTTITISNNNGTWKTLISPRLNANHGHFRNVGFSFWWEEEIIIFDNKKKAFLRKDIVLEVANTDGGAHVDKSLKSTYYDISRRNSISIEVDGMPINNPILPSIRQIAYETIATFDK